MTRIGLAQLLSQPGAAETNRQAGVAAAVELFEQGADIVVLPEMTVPWYSADLDTLEPLAEALDGPTVTEWQALAGLHGGLVVGGFCERSKSGIYNTAVIVSSDGVVSHYRKLHLFDVEKHCFTPGDLGLTVVETAYGAIGLCICYDLRFVEVVRVLALRGADLICVPTAWVRGFDRRQYAEGELIPHAQGALVQANLSQVFIACTSQVGSCDGVEFLGASIVADPYGQVAAGPLSNLNEQSQLVEIDMSEVRRAQARSPLIQPRNDRRTDVYGILHNGKPL